MSDAVALKDEDRIPCKWCSRPTRMLGTKECDNCHELRIRVNSVSWRTLARMRAT